MPRVTQAHCISHDGADEERGFIFIVPRGDDLLVLGGLAEPDEWDLDIGLHNYEPIRAMYRRCLEFLPALADAEIDAAEPVRVGLRPFRRQNVRLERSPAPASSITTDMAARVSPSRGVARWRSPRSSPKAERAEARAAQGRPGIPKGGRASRRAGILHSSRIPRQKSGNRIESRETFGRPGGGG